jgi:two-component system heavy metal sensor histidine kinase CusS
VNRAPPRSLGRWLSWWLAGQTFVGLGVVCVVVYVVTTYSLSVRQGDELNQQEEVVRHLIGEATRGGDLTSLKHKLDDFFVGHRDLRLTLQTASEAPLYASAPAKQENAADGRWSRFEMPSPLVAGGLLRAELKMDTAADGQVLTWLAWTLFACAVAGALVVSACGFWLVRRAMAPVRELALQTRQLGATRLSHRLDGSAQAEELQPLVQQFNALLGRLEQAYEQMEGFNADVAHELRTPLATLIGECELALNEGADLARSHEVLGSNLEELHRLAQVVNTMLFLSQAARGAVARRVPVPSLAALAAEVVEFHDAPLQEAGVDVLVIGDAAGNFDAPLLRQALSNLLANATRFANCGSTIDIKITAESGGMVNVSVSNLGPEIDTAHLPRLFDRFYRADPAREHGTANHGLGLSIVAAIARMHSGQTHACSENGRTSIGFDVAPG